MPFFFPKFLLSTDIISITLYYYNFNIIYQRIMERAFLAALASTR